jgi:hypothetical protein
VTLLASTSNGLVGLEPALLGLELYDGSYGRTIPQGWVGTLHSVPVLLVERLGVCELCCLGRVTKSVVDALPPAITCRTASTYPDLQPQQPARQYVGRFTAAEIKGSAAGGTSIPR